MSDLLSPMNVLMLSGAWLWNALGPLLLSTALLLGVAYALDRLLEPRVSAGLRILLYLPVGLRLLLPAALHTPWGLLGTRAAVSGPGEVTLGVPIVELAGGTEAVSWPTMLLALAYGMGVLALSAHWIFSRRDLRRQLRATEFETSWEGIPVLRHERLGPLVVGVLTPRIVVPQKLLAGDPQALELVLRHELAHVFRRDHLLAALVHAACVLAWPLPPVWLAARRVRLLMELACDERAVRGAEPAMRRRYGQLLLELAEGRQPGSWSSSSLVPSFGSPLAGRLRALGSRRRWPLWLQMPPVLLAGAVALACSGAPESSPPPPPSPAAPPASTPSVAASSPAPASGPAAATENAQIPTAEIRGSLDKQVIKQVIRKRMNDVKGCYEAELAKRPELAGRTTVAFTISADGSVTESSVESSTLDSPAAERCIAAGVRKWTFPPPEGGGLVVVKYPFTFTASRSSAPPPPDPVRNTSPEQKAAVAIVIPEVRRAIQPCFQGGLPGMTRLPPGLTLSVTVGLKGELARIGITANGDAAPDPDVGQCVLRRLMTLDTGARPKTPVRVSMPLTAAGIP